VSAVRVFNDIHRRTGTLWEGRYKAALIDTERYFVFCQRYVELNPVRAGLTAHPTDFRWSSHRHYALGVANPLVSAHSLITSLALDDTERRDAYSTLFKEPLEAQVIEQIRVATNKGRVLGSEAFIKHVESVLGRHASAPKRGRPVKSLALPEDESAEMLI
jgi:putative transposase